MRKRNQAILLRLSDEEMAILTEKVEQSGQNRNAFLVSLIQNGTVYPAEPLLQINQGIQEYNRLIAGIANNANQLARRYNSTDAEPPKESLPAILTAVQLIKNRMEPVWNRVRELLYGNR